MNALSLTWPAGRNSFHPAWLLIPLPPLLQLLYAASANGPGIDPATLFHLLLGLLWIAPWIWWRSGSAPGWVIQGLKEIRGQMPAVLLATLGPSVGAWGSDTEVLFMFTLFIGAILMAVGIFASEFESRTLSTWLGQPRSRSALYGRKLAVLALLFVFVALNALLAAIPHASDWSLRFSEVAVTGGSLLVVFASAPLLALLTRSTIAGATFTVAVPMMLYTPLIYAQGWYYLRWAGQSYPPEGAILTLTLLAGTIYAVVCGVASWRTFLHLEAADSAVATQAPALLRLGRPAEWVTRFIGLGGVHPNPIASLVRKELRLQSTPWIVGLLMVGLALLVLLARALELFTEETEAPKIALIFMSLASVVSLLGTGASCVAEERQIGTHDWQLTQPASVNRQWRVKLATTLVVGVLMGFAWPLLLLRGSLGTAAFASLWPNEGPGLIALVLGAALVLLLLATYASSFSKTTLKAGVSCIATVVTVTTAVALLFGTVDTWRAEPDFRATYWFTDQDSRLPWVPTSEQASRVVSCLVAGFALLGLIQILIFSRYNHRQSLVAFRVIVRQHLALALLAIGAIVVPSWLIHTLSVRQLYRTEVESLTVVIERANVAQRLRPDLCLQVGLRPDATASELAVALLREYGLSAVELLTPPVPPPPMGTNVRLDPILAKRYGIAVPTNAPKAATSVVRIDPALAKRYGLVITTNTAKPAIAK